MKTKKSNAKKLLSLLLVLLLAMSLLAGCGSQNDSGDDSQETVENKVSAIVNVAALNGPTGMGMVKLMDLTDKYAVTTYQAPTDIAPKLINGEVDVAALPSNMAAVLYNKTEGQIVAASQAGAGVLLVSTELDEILELSDRILVVFEGRMMGILDRSEATAERLGLMMAGARQSAG